MTDDKEENSKNQAPNTGMKTPNTKHQRSSKFKAPRRRTCRIFWNLRLGISLALGVWALGIWPATDKGPRTTDNRQLTTNHERFEIRHPPIAEEPRLQRRGGAHAGARHRGEHRHLQRRQRGAASAVSFQESGPARVDLGEQSLEKCSDQSRVSRQSHGLAQSKPRL